MREFNTDFWFFNDFFISLVYEFCTKYFYIVISLSEFLITKSPKLHLIYHCLFYIRI